MSSKSIRNELEEELAKIICQEEELDAELREYFESMAGGLIDVKSNSPSNQDFSSSVKGSLEKIDQFEPCFEAMVQDSKKLALQVEDCRNVSDRMSMIVRRLDIMQIRAQSALACTEDIINLKECRVRMRTAMDEGNLPLAVSVIRQVNEIDVEAASSSEDYIDIKKLEQELRIMVQKEFSKSMEDSNINKVMSICPLLQTLGLEKEARDNFLNFVEKTVFIGVSADANSVEGAKDPATGYAQALSSIFNSSYVILQQYLPMVIQGMESSLGDIYFIRRLHAKCEIEAGMILKRYMKFRNIQEIMASLKNNPQSSSTTITKANSTIITSSSDMHVILDELALLIQYCCMYSKYLKQLCQGAESRKRSNMIIEENSSSSSSSSILVFAGPTEFDKMVDELINKFYMEGEKWLMRIGIRTALPSNQITIGAENENGLDECFFVLHRCGQRAIATNNIQAACAVLHDISDLLSTNLLTKLTDLLLITTNKVSSTLKEQINKYINNTRCDTTNGIDNNGEISKGLMDAMSLLQVRENDSYGDKWGIALYMEYFDIAEMCMRYTDRLNKDISAAGASVYQNESDESLPTLTKNKNSNNSISKSNEMDKLRLCKEDFDGCKISFNQALIKGAERLVNVSQKLMKELLVHTFNRNGPLGGIKFDIPDDKFDSQSNIGLLPKVLIVPFEAIINMCISSVSESNKDVIINLLVTACCERIEHYISQTTFRFAGALKFEECVRSTTALFTKYTTIPIRSKFSRLREILLILTADISSPAVALADNFTYLTINEVRSFVALRVDSNDK